MTQVVAIQCEDGVVVGSDGVATYGNAFQHDYVTPVQKLAIINNQIILGISGPAGLLQRFRSELEKMVQNGGAFKRPPVEAMVTLRMALQLHIEKELDAAKRILRWSPEEIAKATVKIDSLIACSVQSRPCLFNFGFLAEPYLVTDNPPFACIGCSNSIAGAFLNLHRRLFWPKRIPTLSEGIFSTLWTLRHVIENSSSGVGEPIQIAALKESGVKILSDDDLIEHNQNIQNAEQSLRDYSARFSADSPSVPAPPLPPADAA